MKTKFSKLVTFVSLSVVAAMISVIIAAGTIAETKTVAAKEPSYEIEDSSPAIYVAEKNANSVVGVITNVETSNNYNYYYFFGNGGYGNDDDNGESRSMTYSEGSGVVIAEGGYIITNYHVVSGGDSYQILMPDNTKVDAEVVGYDSSYDIAVMRVKERADELEPAAIGTVDKLKVGSTVVAIGNPGGEIFSNTVTQGVVSCLNRDFDGGNTSRTVKYIQHDATINSGNSGGGLFDVNGNLVGINTLKYSTASYYSSTSYEGLGMAIPIDTVIKVAYDIVEYGSVQRAGLGITMKEVSGVDEATDDETPAGIYVYSLLEDGPAEKAGIKKGDIITAIDGQRVTTTEEITDILDSHKAGDTVTVTVARYTTAQSASIDNSQYTIGYGDDDDYYNDIEDYLFGWGYPWNNGGNGNGNGGGRNNNNRRTTTTVEILDIDVTLEILK